MAYFPKKKRGVRKPRMLRKKRVVRRARPSLAVKQYVKRELSRNIENKMHQAEMEMNVKTILADGSTSNEFNGLFPITPYTATGSPIGSTITLVHGTGQATRIGNVVRTKRAVLKGVVFPSPGNVTLNPTPKPMEVCMWIFKLKNRYFGDEINYAQSVFNSSFFQDNASSQGASGSLIDIVRATNQDVVQVMYKRVFKIAYAAGTNSGNVSSNDFKYNQKFSIDVTKYIPKVIKFNDNDDSPSIVHTYCMIAPYNADGSFYTDQSYTVAECHWQLSYTYEDA